MQIVKKVWGEEHWIVNCPEYCGKKMFLKKGMQCSLHYHKIKKETFYVESGLIRFILGLNTFVMKPGDIVEIAPMVQHQFGGLEDSVFFEFSTEHFDEDNYRLTQSGPMQ